MTDEAAGLQRKLKWRGWLMQLFRCALLAAIVVLIHLQHRRAKARAAVESATPSIAVVQSLLGDAQSVNVTDEQSWDVLDADGNSIGRAIQTSPMADDIVGFSGPTNVLIVFDASGKVAGVRVLSSEDTRDHVESVVQDMRFLESFSGAERDSVSSFEVDAVSGATLTCVAIQQSIAKRLGETVSSGKFDNVVKIADVRLLFENAESFTTADGLFEVFDATHTRIGYALRTSPTTDNEIGYQGPTDVLLGLSPDKTVIGFALLRTFDNEEPYVRYVREDYGFPAIFNELSLSDVAAFDLEAEEIEGVAGATMTSMTVARNLIAATKEHLKPPPRPAKAASSIASRDIGTISVVVVGLLVGLTSLRGRKWVRLAFQAVLIGYLGLMNGDMVSQALLVGWAKNGVQLGSSLGLVVLSVAAFAVPIFTGRNVYCSQLCPHGAVQQLVRNRIPWRVKLGKRLTRGLSLVPGLLLLWVVIVAACGLGFSLVDVEPFDAWLFRVAGIATIAVAIVGLVASLFVPMAYCRFGCPTGALLQFVRTNRKSHEFSIRDGLAAVCLAVAGVAYWTGM